MVSAQKVSQPCALLADNPVSVKVVFRNGHFTSRSSCISARLGDSGESVTTLTSLSPFPEVKFQ